MGKGGCRAGLLACGALLASSPAAASTYSPNRLGDHPAGPCTHANCTLREAVIKANDHSGADTILLRPGKTYRLSIPGTDEQQAGAGDLDINSVLTIRSSGRKLATIRQSPGTDRVIETGVLTPANVKLEHLKITGGNGGEANGFAHGGGILNDGGTLSVIRSRVVNNEAVAGIVGAGGGGIAAQNTMVTSTTRIVRSTIAHNQTNSEGAVGGGLLGQGAAMIVRRSRVVANQGSDGGGIWAYDMRVDRSTIAGNAAYTGGGVYLMTSQGSGTITNSTISGNKAGAGAGVASANVLTLRNDTISGNRAAGDGGGLWTTDSGVSSLSNVTVAQNRADSDDNASGDGGGLANLGSGQTALRNSLIVKNRGHNGALDDCDAASYTSDGHNLTTTACLGLGAVTHDLLTGSPKIGRLGAHGGPTKTIPLLAGSPAIGHADHSAPPRDQRGTKRDKHPDAGAYERR